MKKRIIKTLLSGAAAGFLCVIAPNGSYNNTPVAIYQHPFNITVFYLIYLAVQSDHIYDLVMYSVRFKTIAAAKLYQFLEMFVSEFIYIAVYFSCSCVISCVMLADSFGIIFEPFRCALFLVTALFNLSIMNVLFVNLNYLAKKQTVFFIETGIILSGLALCFAAPAIAPYIYVWFYGVYPKTTISPIISVSAYIIWMGAALLIGSVPQKDILRKE